MIVWQIGMKLLANGMRTCSIQTLYHTASCGNTQLCNIDRRVNGMRYNSLTDTYALYLLIRRSSRPINHGVWIIVTTKLLCAFWRRSCWENQLCYIQAYKWDNGFTRSSATNWWSLSFDAPFSEQWTFFCDRPGASSVEWTANYYIVVLLLIRPFVCFRSIALRMHSV
jgi:hypothetical protein